MNSADLYRSFNELDDDVLRRSEGGTDKKAFPRKRLWAIAACVAIVLGLTLNVEASSGGVSNLFAPLFGFAQADIVDAIGRPIGASASADGYTVTAEAVIGDQYNVAVVYTVRREDGQPITGKLNFQEWDTNILSESGGGGSLFPITDPEHPEQITLIESWSASSPLFGRYITVSFSNLSVYNEENSSIVAEGPWVLNYTLRYEDSTQSIPVKQLKVESEAGKQYQVNKILLSPIGLHMQGLYFDPAWGAPNTLDDFKVAIKKKTGEVIPLENATRGCSFSENSASAKISFEAMFQAPIPLDEIESLLICDGELPVT